MLTVPFRRLRFDACRILPFLFYSKNSRFLFSSTNIRSNSQASPLVEGDPSSPWRQCYRDMNYNRWDVWDCKTMSQVWDNTVQKYGNRDCFGTRQCTLVSEEFQDDGRVFENFQLGEYRWRTFREVDERVNDVLNGLKEIGHRDREPVLIYSETREEFTTLMLGCFKSCVPVVTVYATLGFDALIHSIKECQPMTIFATPKLLNTVAKAVGNVRSVKNVVFFSHRDPSVKVVVPNELKYSKIACMNFETLIQRGNSAEAYEVPRDKANANDVAMIMYTSGTTGAPKGVVLLQKNLVASVVAHSERSPVGVGDTYVGYLPLAHIFEVCIELTMLSLGCRIGFSSPLTLFDGSSGLMKGQNGDCSALKPTILAGTPAVFNRLLQAVNDHIANSPTWKQDLFRKLYSFLEQSFSRGYKDFLLGPIAFRRLRNLLGGRAKTLFTGGAPMNPDTHHYLRICLGCNFIQGYGTTETAGCGIVGTASNISSHEVGPPQIGCDVILREWKEGGYSPKNAVPQGEILLGGDIVASGYLNNEEQTRESFFDMYGKRWFATGDIGEIRKDGSIRIIDRKKELVKLAQGEYISLSKVESYIATVSFVESVCVYGDMFTDYLVALIVPRKEQLHNLAVKIGIYETSFETLCAMEELKEILLSHIHSHCKGKLHRTEIPRKIHMCHEPWTPSSGMVTAALKLQRRNVERRFREEIRAMYGRI